MATYILKVQIVEMNDHKFYARSVPGWANVIGEAYIECPVINEVVFVPDNVLQWSEKEYSFV